MNFQAYAVTGTMPEKIGIPLFADIAAACLVDLTAGNARSRLTDAGSLGLPDNVVYFFMQSRYFSQKDRSGQIGIVPLIDSPHVYQHGVIVLDRGLIRLAVRHRGPCAGRDNDVKSRFFGSDGLGVKFKPSLDFPFAHAGT